jgi:hypothetical protein
MGSVYASDSTKPVAKQPAHGASVRVDLLHSPALGCGQLLVRCLCIRGETGLCLAFALSFIPFTCVGRKDTP